MGKLKTLSIALEFFLAIGSGKFEITANAVPPTARIRQAAIEGDLVILILEDESFEYVPKNQTIPALDAPHYRRIDD